MGIRYYDESLFKKIQKWVKDPNLVILKPGEVTRLFQVTADMTNDKPLTLPLIALSRGNDVEILSTNKKPLSFDGKLLDSENDLSKQLNAIPISIEYQLDIYTKFYDEADEYLRNFIFNFINYPKLSIEIPYNDTQIIHNSNVRIVSTIQDTSDIPQRLFSGQFTRWTMRLVIDDAYLFSVPVSKNVHISETSELII